MRKVREGTAKTSKSNQKTGKYSPQKKYKGFKMIELTMRWKTVTVQKYLYAAGK